MFEASLRVLLCLAFGVLVGCGGSNGGGDDLPFERTEDRAPCADHDALRRPFFGDTHVHSALSFDAYINDVRVTPEETYRFARGEPVAVPPLDAEGRGTQIVSLDTPLDFTVLTDHAELLAEVQECTTPGSAVFDTVLCTQYREGTALSTVIWGFTLVPANPRRLPICDTIDCRAIGGEVWSDLQGLAERYYDRGAPCSFTTFVGYEWAGNTGISNFHRNVIFRNARVPALPTTYFEASTAQGLWAALERDCLDGIDGCDVLAIPHNSNASNGRMFRAEYPGATTIDEQRAQAAFRADMEPLVEIYQHKGDSECRNGLSGFIGEPDELCEFEKWRPSNVADCMGGVGNGGISYAGCVGAVDFVRGALLTGLQEEERLGVNPYRLGIIASTDSHNGTPGAVSEASYAGHVGKVEQGPVERLQPVLPVRPPGGIVNSPGGLAAVWAEENSRDAIFEAMRRRETFGTSGPRITVRFFGGWDYPEGLCASADLVSVGDAQGVPMGGTLPPRDDGATGAPVFLVSALRDPDVGERRGTPLQRIQIIKGWTDSSGVGHYRTFEVGGDPANGAGVNLETCEAFGEGFDSLCTRWADPDFDAAERAYYYARVVENPTCRWSQRDCLRVSTEQREALCSDPEIEPVVQERAWTSPIWYRPLSS